MTCNGNPEALAAQRADWTRISGLDCSTAADLRATNRGGRTEFEVISAPAPAN